MKLWLVGQSYTNEHPKAWEFQGIFDSEELAVSECKGEKWFIAMVTMNEPVPIETVPFPEPVYYPFFNHETEEWGDVPMIRSGDVKK